MIIEAWLQESGVVPYIPVGKRSIFSLWRIVMLTGMVATPLGTIYLAETWKKGKESGLSFSGYFFSAILSLFILTATAMSLSALGILSPLGVSSQMVSRLLFARCFFVVIWSVGAATLCSSITNGPGGAVLSLGLFSIALFPGLSGSSMSWWFVAPLGDMASTVNSMSTGWEATLAVAAHSAFYLIAGALILKRTLR